MRDLISRLTLNTSLLPRTGDDTYPELASHDRGGMPRGKRRDFRNALTRSY